MVSSFAENEGLARDYIAKSDVHFNIFFFKFPFVDIYHNTKISDSQFKRQKCLYNTVRYINNSTINRCTQINIII